VPFIFETSVSLATRREIAKDSIKTFGKNSAKRFSIVKSTSITQNIPPKQIYVKIHLLKLNEGFAMAFKYENGKVIQVSMPHITGEDAKKMLNAKVPKELIKRIKAKKFITEAA